MTLTLTMIVKNESDVLDRALDGISGVADEIVVVDTGSTDDTKAIARRYTDKVYDFEWVDDFSAARNFALSQATCEYCMWLDADDIVPDKTVRGIKRLRTENDGATDVFMMPYVIGVAPNGKPEFSYLRERIVKNRDDFRFVGRVHEAIVPSGTIKTLPYSIVHGKPQERNTGTRNLDIYKRMIAEGVTLSPREKYYYARELYFNGHISDAAREFYEFVSANKGLSANLSDACVLLSRCLKRSGDNDGALRAALNALAYDNCPNAEACCEIGGLFFEKTDYRSAKFWYENALRLKPDRQNGMFVRSDAFGITPLIWLTVCYDRLGDIKRAFRYHTRAKKLYPFHPSVVANTRYFAALGFI